MEHTIFHRSLTKSVPDEYASVYFGMGCFWGAEKLFWSLPHIWLTSVGYGGGHTDAPTYEEVCSGRSGHAELVMVAYHRRLQPFAKILRLFWEGHDPTQGHRQGNDIGSQYRSAIFTANEDQLKQALASRDHYQKQLDNRGFGRITTEIAPIKNYYLAEEYHQQYLSKNPGGYCGLAGTGISYAK